MNIIKQQVERQFSNLPQDQQEDVYVSSAEQQ
jgi:hypothetical protein